MSISVVIVCRDAAAQLPRALDSVAAQDSLHECVVVDGASTDGTVEILHAAQARLGDVLRWTSEADAGIYDAMNKGIARSHGTHILFLGADDVLLPGGVAALQEAIASRPDADLVYGDAVLVEPDGRTRRMAAHEAPREIDGIPRSMPVLHQACAFSRHSYDTLGPFDDSFRIAGDYEFYLRFHHARLASVHVPVEVAAFSLSGLSATSGRATAEEYRRARVMHGVSPVVARVAMLASLVNVTMARIARRLV